MARESKQHSISAGERIRAARVAAGLTQESLAREVHLSRATLARCSCQRPYVLR